MVGAGALGNWGSVILAAEHPGRLTIFDGDAAPALHNCNRQILLAPIFARAACKGVGGGRIAGDRDAGVRSKVAVLVDALNAFDPSPSDGVAIDPTNELRYVGVERFVTEPGDLADVLGAVDAVLCFPDNDRARLVTTTAARAAGVLCSTAGSSALGAQAVTTESHRACYRCVTRKGEASGEAPRQTCLEENEAVVTSNMIGAALALSEIRASLSGRPASNVRFFGEPARGGRAPNRLGRMIADPACAHMPSRQRR